MECLSGFVTKRRRSGTSRRPRTDWHIKLEGSDVSPPSSTPSSNNANKLSLDENAAFDTSFLKKEFNLNSSAPRTSSFNKIEGVAASRKIRKDDQKYGNLDEFYRNGISGGGRSGSSDHRRGESDLKRCSEGVLAPANQRSASTFRDDSEMQSRSPDGYVGKGSGCNLNQLAGAPNGSDEKKLRKVKLKVGGVTRTIHAEPENSNGRLSSAKSSRPSDASQRRPKLILQDNSDDDHTPADKGNDLQQVQQKGFSEGSFSREALRGKPAEESQDLEPFSEAVRKSKRVPKWRMLEGASDDGCEDDEIRYLERRKSSKAGKGDNVDGWEDNVKNRKILKVSKSKRAGYDVDEDFGFSRPAKDSRKKPRTESEPYHEEHVEEDGLSCGHKEFADTSTDARTEPLTTRQRALKSGKDTDAGGSLIEFPNGLPPAPPRKQKEKLSEEEQQAKKAEAAQRRRLQVEKQAKELEAEAIRKIRGQDSSRKKKEEKERKQRDEKAQKKAAESLVLAPGTIRCVMGPTGTVLMFSGDIDLQSLFGSKPLSYPPPREKCAGPSCTNPYKYRDSKLKLPLCSLQCYRAVQEDSQPVSTR